MRNASYPLLLAGLLTLAGCSAAVSRPLPTLHTQGTSGARAWLTTADGTQKLAAQPGLTFKTGVSGGTTGITVDPRVTYQVVDGFGAALTESSAHLIRSLSVTRQDALLKALFDPNSGAGLSYLRLPLGASDFALSSYTYDDLPDGAADPDLTHFSVNRDERAVLPLARDVRRIAPQLRFMGTPWSAPAWMKDSGALNGGTLKREHEATYGRYLARSAQAFADAGVPLDTITLQNEPRHDTTAYPSMRLEPSAAATVATTLASNLRSAGQQVKILGWDHNWDDAAYPVALLSDASANEAISGTAWHCYAGDPSAMTAVKTQFATKDVYFTECSGGAWATNWGANLGWNMQNLIIGATRNYGRTVLLWNLALNPQGGPTNGGCQNCRGVVTVDPATGAVTYNEEYYALAHAAKFVRPGALRVASTSYGAGNLQSVAFVNPDGSRALIVLNGSGSARKFNVSEGGRGYSASLPAGAVATFTWPQP